MCTIFFENYDAHHPPVAKCWWIYPSSGSICHILSAFSTQDDDPILVTQNEKHLCVFLFHTTLPNHFLSTQMAAAVFESKDPVYHLP